MSSIETPLSEKDPIRAIFYRFDDGRQVTSTLWIVAADGKKGIYSILDESFILLPEFDEILFESERRICTVRKGDEFGTFCLKQMAFTSGTIKFNKRPQIDFDQLVCGPAAIFGS